MPSLFDRRNLELGGLLVQKLTELRRGRNAIVAGGPIADCPGRGDLRRVLLRPQLSALFINALIIFRRRHGVVIRIFRIPDRRDRRGGRAFDPPDVIDQPRLTGRRQNFVIVVACQRGVDHAESGNEGGDGQDFVQVIHNIFSFSVYRRRDCPAVLFLIRRRWANPLKKKKALGKRLTLATEMACESRVIKKPEEKNAEITG